MFVFGTLFFPFNSPLYFKDTLESEEEVKISGFGKFEVKKKSERRGRNQQTGADLTIDPRKIVTFKPSGILKDRMNTPSR